MARFKLEWDDAHDANEIAEVLYAASLGPDGKVRDVGFADDANALWKQVQAYEEQMEEAANG